MSKLVIKRRIGEGFRVGDTFHVKVVERHGNQITLAITADPGTLILRDEVADKTAEVKG